MAVLSVVWGVSAFGGPLYGGLMQTLLSWRWAFLLFAAAIVLAIACVPLLRNEPERPHKGQGPRNFPALALTCLALGITAIATAGVEPRAFVSVALVLVGLAGIVIFFVLDARNKKSRLFPAAPFNPNTVVGSGMLMVAAMSFRPVPLASTARSCWPRSMISRR